MSQEEKVEETQIQETATEQEATAGSDAVNLNGLFAFKAGMSSVYDENGQIVPVTVLRYENWFVSQLKTEDKDGYQAIQIACGPKKKKNANKAEVGHLKAAGFENGARLVKEIRQDLPEGVKLGQRVKIESFNVGDKVKVTSRSKGRGFAGGMKRYNFGGGPAAHGSGFHRRPGSSGNRTTPGRIMPGKRMPGHFGDETITVRNVKVVGVIPEENAILLKGPVPGSRNSLVKMVKE